MELRGRESLETMADIYSIFLATEALEKAYIRDSITHREYNQVCCKLIAQYKTCLNSLGDDFDIKKFMSNFEIKCPGAYHRLVEIGVPATSEYVSGEGGNITKHVAETVQHFITILDALKLNLTAVDQIHPHLTDLIQSISQVRTLSPNYQGKERIIYWLKTLHKMKASEELQPAEVRQLTFDLETALADFHRELQS